MSTFFSSFRGAAAEHLPQSSSSPSPQIGQVMAITLLSNANLDVNVLINTKLQLINLAEERAKQHRKEITKTVRVEMYDKLLQIVKDFENVKNLNANNEGTTKMGVGITTQVLD